MFVKVSPLGVGEEHIYETGVHVAYGTQISRVTPSDRDYDEELGGHFAMIHNSVVEEPDDFHGEDGEPYWAYRFAWWSDECGITGLVTSHRLFILSDSGKTIDSVR